MSYLNTTIRLFTLVPFLYMSYAQVTRMLYWPKPDMRMSALLESDLAYKITLNLSGATEIRTRDTRMQI